MGYLNKNNFKIEYEKVGATLYVNSRIIHFKWNEIIKIVGYKLDLITTDEICLLIELDDNQKYQITESVNGWSNFVEALKIQFEEIDKQWELKIARPAFKTNETILYQRNNNVS